jgi:predicted acyltransferase (DUF342 family)
MASDVERLHYYERQYLGASDFEAQQVYHRDTLRRHLLGPHTWGIVTGLELTAAALAGGEVEVWIEPGMAVDVFGRTILVLERYPVSKALFDSLPFDPGVPVRWIPLSLRYRDEGTSPARVGWEVCDAEDSSYRIRETFRVEIGPPVHGRIRVAGEAVDARTPGRDDASVPFQELPQGDRDLWWVPLGKVGWQASADPSISGSFVEPKQPNEIATALEGRHWIGTVAAEVLAPSGRIRIRDRSEATNLAAETDDFAAVEGQLRVDELLTARDRIHLTGGLRVRLTQDSDIERNRVVVGVDEPLEERFRIDSTGDVELKGSLEIGGDVHAAGDAAVDGDAVVSGGLSVKRGFDVGEDTRLDGKLSVAKATTLSDTLDVASDVTARANVDVAGSVRLNQKLVVRGAGGVEDTDVLSIERVRRAADQNDLRIQIGDNLSGDDRLVVGPLYVGDAQFKEQFVVNNRGDVSIAGNLSVTGTNNLFKVRTFEFVTPNDLPQNRPDRPFSWTIPYAGEFTQVYGGFVVLQGFSLWELHSRADFVNPAKWSHAPDTNAIIQHAFVVLDNLQLTFATGRCYVSESLAAQEGDNSTLFSLVVLGRN